MIKNVLGIMTGTSCDGIDISYMQTDGESYINPVSFKSVAFDDGLKSSLLDLGKEAKKVGISILSKDSTKEIIKIYTSAVSFAISEYFSEFPFDLIGFHGQTILHNPNGKITIQIGDAEYLKEKHKCDIVHNFRENDVLNGGQGAPFAPLYHKYLMKKYFPDKVGSFVNIGGVANVTYYDPKDDILMGWDTGPGNGLIDSLCKKHFGCDYDDKGKIASKGNADISILQNALSNSYFAKKPPKSLDRNDFNISLFSDLNPQDAIATATDFTSKSILLSDKFFPKKVDYRLVSGGGIYNKTLINKISSLSGCDVIIADELGINSQAIEAELFAWLAVRSLKGLYISAPNITGVGSYVSGGDLLRI